MLKTCESFPDGCIIFLDELDALATSRSTGGWVGHRGRAQRARALMAAHALAGPRPAALARSAGVAAVCLCSERGGALAPG